MRIKNTSNKGNIHNMNNIKNTALLFCMLLTSMMVQAQSNGNRLSVGVGALYEKGFDASLAVEHETQNHNAWEYFANGYVKYSKDERAGHITKDSFWKNYSTWGLGVAYKPCVYRAKNAYGGLRIGASGGSDTHDFVGWANIGYEQNYVLRHGWHLFWQIKTDLCVNGKDLFRTGIVLGFKIPTGSR